MKKCRTSTHAVSKSYGMAKLLRIMKLTAILLLIATLQVFSNGVYSQHTELTLNLGESSVGQVLTEIENQSEFYFLFNQMPRVHHLIHITGAVPGVALDHQNTGGN